MKILFTDCWVGCYQGEGSYEGGTCPDCLITNVPEDEDTDELFDIYLFCLCDGFNGHDKKNFETKVVKRTSKKRSPVQITSLNDLIDCSKEFIEIDYDDLIEWFDEYDEYED
jgi:hypothetical protein